MRFLITVALFWFSQYVFMPYFTPHLRGLGLVGSVAGLIIGMYGFSQMALRIPFGVTANRTGNHRVFMLLGFGCLIVAGAVLRVSSYPAAFVAARLLAGVSSATWVSFTVFYTGIYRGATGKAIAAVMIANQMGVAASYLFGIFLFDRLGMNVMFVISVIAAVAGAALLLTVREDRGGGRAAGGMNLRDFIGVLGDRSLLLFSGIAALLQLVTFATVMSFTTDYVKNEIGTGGSELAFLSVIFSGSGVLGSYWIRTRFSDRLPRGAQLAGSFALLAVYCAVVPNTGSLAVIYFMQFVGGFGQSVAMTATMALALSNVVPANRSAAMGIYQSVYGIGMTLGPVVMGKLIDLTGLFRTASYFMALICVAGIAWCLLGVRARLVSPNGR